MVRIPPIQGVQAYDSGSSDALNNSIIYVNNIEYSMDLNNASSDGNFGPKFSLCQTSLENLKSQLPPVLSNILPLLYSACQNYITPAHAGEQSFGVVEGICEAYKSVATYLQTNACLPTLNFEDVRACKKVTALYTYLTPPGLAPNETDLNNALMALPYLTIPPPYSHLLACFQKYASVAEDPSDSNMSRVQGSLYGVVQVLQTLLPQ